MIVFKEGNDYSCSKCCFAYLSCGCLMRECHKEHREDGKSGHFVEEIEVVE